MAVCSMCQDAIRGEHGRDFMGTKIVVEWARGPRDRVRKSGGWANPVGGGAFWSVG